MFGKISIIGCGLIGSSILRAAQENKLATKISVYDKSNKVTEYLMGKELLLGKTQRVPHGLMREFNDGEKTYLLDEKGVDFMSEAVLLHGLISDNENNVGNISLQFIPDK